MSKWDTSAVTGGVQGRVTPRHVVILSKQLREGYASRAGDHFTESPTESYLKLVNHCRAEAPQERRASKCMVRAVVQKHLYILEWHNRSCSVPYFTVQWTGASNGGLYDEAHNTANSRALSHWPSEQHVTQGEAMSTVEGHDSNTFRSRNEWN